MDEKDFRKSSVRLQEVGKVIETLPPEIRSDAFVILKAYVSKDTETPADIGDPKDDMDVGGVGLFGKFSHDRPSDNVRLIAGYFFQEFGSEVFSVEEVRAMASEAGITIPERVDMTLAAAQENEKHLFAKAGRGKFKPTVHGEAYLKATYKVKKGTKKRGPESAETP
jgi:hypothetical protein